MLIILFDLILYPFPINFLCGNKVGLHRFIICFIVSDSEHSVEKLEEKGYACDSGVQKLHCLLLCLIWNWFLTGTGSEFPLKLIKWENISTPFV